MDNLINTLIPDAVELLMENFILQRKNNPEVFRELIRNEKAIRKFMIKNFGYQLKLDSETAKLEKKPYFARSWMGIENFSNELDYVFLMATLASLEKRIFRNGKELKQWYWANIEKSVQNISLRSLQYIDQVKPVKGNKVFVLENSGVYSSVLDELKEVYPVVCTHGNFKLSGILLLDKLVQDGAELYYSGDLDVNGVMMANSLKTRYGSKVHFWRMGREEYLRCVSQVYITSTSLERLNSVIESELKEVIEEIHKIKKAGYQEPLLELYLSDIKKIYS